MQRICSFRDTISQPSSVVFTMDRNSPDSRDAVPRLFWAAEVSQHPGHVTSAPCDVRRRCIFFCISQHHHRQLHGVLFCSSARIMSQQIVPLDYATPEFPSLYSPATVIRGESKYLFFTSDVWRFTLYWTLLLYGGTHITAASYGVLTQWRNWRIIWIMPLVYTVIAGLEGLLAGSVVGLVYVPDTA